MGTIYGHNRVMNEDPSVSEQPTNSVGANARSRTEMGVNPPDPKSVTSPNPESTQSSIEAASGATVRTERTQETAYGHSDGHTAKSPTWRPPVRTAIRDGDDYLIPLTRGRKARIDAVDCERVGALNWRVKIDKDGRAYACAHKPGSGKRGKGIPMHRFILDAEPGEIVDHRDGDGLNNKRNNLRKCSNAENIRNSRPHKGRPVKGVTRYGDHYRAQIMVNYKKFNLGKFLSLEAARKAYDAAARLHFGEFARTNFPPEPPHAGAPR